MIRLKLRYSLAVFSWLSIGSLGGCTTDAPWRPDAETMSSSEAAFWPSDLLIVTPTPAMRTRAIISVSLAGRKELSSVDRPDFEPPVKLRSHRTNWTQLGWLKLNWTRQFLRSFVFRRKFIYLFNILERIREYKRSQYCQFYRCIWLSRHIQTAAFPTQILVEAVGLRCDVELSA